MLTIEQAAEALAAGRTTARALVEEALARVEREPRAFVDLQSEAALASADAMDALRRAGRAPSRFAGIPVTIKDLFDQKGQVTLAGSVARKGEEAAAEDAPVVARLLAAGFVILGRTNMSEFAFSGLGVNPHYGTPASAWDRATGRLPGGSSSGAGVAAAEGMGFGGLGSDTGGSCRIPAALNGIVGFKPTASRVPLAGALPLSFTLDSVGPLARSVSCCQILDGIIADTPTTPATLPMRGLRLAVLRNYVEQGMEEAVATAYQAALARLSALGAVLTDIRIADIEALPAINAKGGFTAAESWTWHHDLLDRKGDAYDPIIAPRIRRGAAMTAEDYISLQAARRNVIAAVAPQTAPFDAVLMPTVPLLPPPIAAVENVDEFTRINMLMLRNCSVGNFLDRCAISLPCQKPGEAPVGLMLMGEHGGDEKLFAVAKAVEAALA
ncbi:amidase [Rhodovarius lipocyclicus]|uniref:amidase n=1 Tax=Rhodovarius lipocyclicus TaxID=268410 RepID=UPI00135B1ACD|nr:amidase [Rhodovarius lipocyclicus]